MPHSRPPASIRYVPCCPPGPSAYAIELTATGVIGRSTWPWAGRGVRGRELLTAELSKLEERVDTLAELATSPADPTAANDRRRGLSDQENQELKSAIATLEDVNSICLEGRRINVRLAGDPTRWMFLLSRAAECEKRAEMAFAQNRDTEVITPTAAPTMACTSSFGCCRCD